MDYLGFIAAWVVIAMLFVVGVVWSHLKFSSEKRVTFIVMGCEKQLAFSSLVEIECPRVEVEGFSFVGWYRDPACTEAFDGKFEEETTLYAKLQKQNI